MELRRTALALAVLPFTLAGCYGNLSFGYGPDDDPPSVSLAASPTTAAAGETVALVAAADDDYVVREVQFFRVDAVGDTLLGIDSSAPYALETAMPAGSGSEVRYFARAVDDAGQRGESAEVAVARR